MDSFGGYDFGLDAVQEERASRLHRETLIIDTMFQGPCGYRSFSEEATSELAALRQEEPELITTFAAALYRPIREAVAGNSKELEETWAGSGVTGANREIDNWVPDLFGQFAAHQASFDRLPWLRKALVAADFRRAHADGERAGYLSTQDTIHFGADLDLVRTACDLGLRMLQLTYNSQNLVGAGCTERTDAGVTHFGRKLIALMDELGIIVDTSHCGPRTTLDACELSERPVVASHTSAAALYPVDRAKSDDELKAIAETGGTVGIYAVPFFLGDSPGVTIEAMLDHVVYVSELVGVEHVTIGTDWPMQLPKNVLREVMAPLSATAGFRDEHKLDTTATLLGFDDYRDYPNITRGLVARGFGDAEITAILGANFLRVFEAVCG